MGECLGGSGSWVSSSRLGLMAGCARVLCAHMFCDRACICKLYVHKYIQWQDARMHVLWQTHMCSSIPGTHMFFVHMCAVACCMAHVLLQKQFYNRIHTCSWKHAYMFCDDTFIVMVCIFECTHIICTYIFYYRMYTGMLYDRNILACFMMVCTHTCSIIRSTQDVRIAQACSRMELA